ncbi:energy-coupling factor transporter ATP-binding protein EcfA1 [Tepidanaerobacter syntrophicus]|uniref:ABC transporter ATP-binding protein n=1 Tax=Tepidanaerobacter syntrophicus TaxID=224999 RepID=A0A0U9I3I5_9FIRM|nr:MULTISPECIES: energy-coupling factor transporter ATPase [Tepidanaerobacter]GAQ24664.1 energy-coupling factor transport system ATP-binding protein [Tepidanaerobacter syntrophicus]GLI19066.1 energy-coupling factor transporter ATP-binding protein EcfA1 [Tepidanaerobacter syntrophicus]HHV83421.1 energy-coupling factor transporter ATPase [Tepidanaerobacter syntrophicus]
MRIAAEIVAVDVYYQYAVSSDLALKDINLKINPGEFVAIIGPNGSGKSTLAKLFNGLFVPTQGDVFVAGFNTKNQEDIWEIRRRAGMVFQNPDNQIVATIVEEDVAFGPENLGIPPEEIRRRVKEALEIVELTEYADKAPHLLSGGQKQRVAIAGIIAMKPDCIILDEPTAMLDPVGRKEVISTVKRLNKEEGKTVVLITHFMEEAVQADRILVMEKGKIVMEGKPNEIFSQVDRLKKIGLDVPQVTELAYKLSKDGIPIRKDILSVEEMVDCLCRLM